MPDLFAFEIPAKYFEPYTVLKPFYAKVAYTGKGTDVKIEEVAFSPMCLEHMNRAPGLMNDINAALLKKIQDLSDVGVHVD